MLFHDNRLTGQVPASICRLFTTGILFNLWSDCLKEDSLTCECCTVCCSAPGKCGPTSDIGQNQEYEVSSLLSVHDNKGMTVTAIGTKPIGDENVPGQLPVTEDVPQVTDVTVVGLTKQETILQTKQVEEKTTVAVTEHSDSGSSQSIPKLHQEQSNAESIIAVVPPAASRADQSSGLFLESNQTTASGDAISIESVQHEGNDTIVVQM